MTRLLVRLLEFWSGDRYVPVRLLLDAYPPQGADPEWLRTVNAAIDYARQRMR